MATPQSTATHVVLTNETYAEILATSAGFKERVAELEQLHSYRRKVEHEVDAAHQNQLAASEAARAQAEERASFELKKAQEFYARLATVTAERDAALRDLVISNGETDEVRGQLTEAKRYLNDSDRELSEARAHAGVLREALSEQMKPLPYNPDESQWSEPGDEKLREEYVAEWARRDALGTAALSSGAGREAAEEMERLRERVRELEEAIEARDRCTAKQNADAEEYLGARGQPFVAVGKGFIRMLEAGFALVEPLTAERDALKASLSTALARASTLEEQLQQLNGTPQRRFVEILRKLEEMFGPHPEPYRSDEAAEAHYLRCVATALARQEAMRGVVEAARHIAAHADAMPSPAMWGSLLAALDALPEEK